MTEPEIVITDAPDEAAQSAVSDGLMAYNREQAGYYDGLPLAVIARDPTTGQPLGGILARTLYGMLYVDLVFLPNSLRGQDLGSRMLRAVEDEAVRRGCQSAVLITISFQAPGFYAKLGWQEFGRVRCDPPGTSRVFFRKTLSPG